MKILYYVTGHGLGHATRTVAIVRELLKKRIDVVIRNDDPLGFFKRSLPQIRILQGQTDFKPAMDKKNGMRFDIKKTRENLATWIDEMPKTIEKESQLIQKIQPDVIISDVSFMPIIAASGKKIKCAIVSNFVWSDTLNLSKNARRYIKDAYSRASLVVKLPLGTQMRFKNTYKAGLVARKVIKSKSTIRKKLGVKKSEKLVLVSLSGLNKIKLEPSYGVKILDISNYSTIKKKGMDLVEGQDLINAADLVVCKCGYGFASECLSRGTRFYYVLESSHKEAKAIHKGLLQLGLKNRIGVSRLRDTEINQSFIESAGSMKTELDNHKVAEQMIKLADRVI